MNLIFTQPPSGKCPVQAEGTIDGHEFYFRSRGSHWALYVASEGSGDPLNSCAWQLVEEYPGAKDEEPVVISGRSMKFSAGWATEAECLDFINRAAAMFVAQQEKQP